MKRSGFFSSLFTAILVAVVLFGILFFLAPDVSQQFFGFSWRSSQDAKNMKLVVADILDDAQVPQETIDTYLRKWDDVEFQEKLLSAAQQGKDSMVEFLSKATDGLDIGKLDAEELKNKISSGFSSSALGKFTSAQIKSLQRVLAGALDSL
jgi:hypothetical protein